MSEPRGDVGEEQRDALIEWLIDIGYPFDFTFDTKPPVDADALARRWNERDDWGVPHEDALEVICDESGLVSKSAKPVAAVDMGDTR